MSYYVYILESIKDGRYYIGSTLDVEKRLKFHNAGKQRSKKYRIPIRIVCTEELPDKKTDLRREIGS